MPKIIFSDFDDTMMYYYSENNFFDEYKIDVLKKVQENVIKFCIVSGRCITFFERFPNLLEVVDYIIGSNGACIYDVKNKKILNQDIISEESFCGVIKYVNNNNYDLLLNCGDKRYKIGDWYVTNCEEYNDNNKPLCDQIIMALPVNRMEEGFKYLENFKDIKVNNISYWDDLVSIDINNIDVSKGKSVKWLCDCLEIDTKDTLAFGDGDNDKSMFEVVDKGIAVGNATDKLKIASNDVILDCRDDAIYKYMEDNILK